MNIIDARGEICPKPLILTRKGLKSAAPDEVFTVLIDNETSKENVERFLAENKVSFLVSQKGTEFEIKITKGRSELLNENVEEFCPIAGASSNSGDLIIFNKDGVGVGPEELTSLLVKGFFTTVSEVDTPPLGIVFYNSGIKLALKDSAVIEEIKNIQSKGAKILVCGTCVDHYDVKDQVAIGTISNMYDILSLMQEAKKVFTP